MSSIIGAANPGSDRPLTLMLDWDTADGLDAYLQQGESPFVDALLVAIAEARAAYATMQAVQNMG